MPMRACVIVQIPVRADTQPADTRIMLPGSTLNDSEEKIAPSAWFWPQGPDPEVETPTGTLLILAPPHRQL